MKAANHYDKCITNKFLNKQVFKTVTNIYRIFTRTRAIQIRPEGLQFKLFLNKVLYRVLQSTKTIATNLARVLPMPI